MNESHEVLRPSVRGPIITDKTTLAELQAAGATTLSDIPIVELLEYIRNTCLRVASDVEADKELQWSGKWAEAVQHIQGAIDSIEESF